VCVCQPLKCVQTSFSMGRPHALKPVSAGAPSCSHTSFFWGALMLLYQFLLVLRPHALVPVYSGTPSCSRTSFFWFCAFMLSYQFILGRPHALVPVSSGSAPLCSRTRLFWGALMLSYQFLQLTTRTAECGSIGCYNSIKTFNGKYTPKKLHKQTVLNKTFTTITNNQFSLN
jgi:hypothetical protein